MPELPEVETVACQLKPQLLGKRLLGLRIHDLKLRSVRGKIPKNSVVRDVRRVGKQVLIEWQTSRDKRFLFVHLRMTGRLLWLPKAKPSKTKDKPRAEFHFAEGCLKFVDVRRFGTLEVSNDPESCRTAGCDPFSPNFTPAALGTLIAGSKQPIKPWLLRQEKVVGLGNIYASEILHRARVHPIRPAASLSDRELRLVHRKMREVLTAAIRACGTTFADFQDSRGEVGNFQEFLRVYGRIGKRCYRCRPRKTASIERILQAGRSTFFCPQCQK